MRNELKDIARNNNGFISSKDASRERIARRELSECVSEGTLIRVSRGLYALPDTWEDPFVVAQYRFSRGVFSHESALYLHGLTDRVPDSLTLTFPYGYNTSGVLKAGYIAKTVSKENHDLGMYEIKTLYGNTVASYGPERTFCDLFRANSSPDMQLITPALKSYLRRNDKNPVLLMELAQRLGVDRRIRPYLEALL